MTKSKPHARRTPPAVLSTLPERAELTVRLPGLEAVLVDVVKIAAAKAAEDAGDDVGRARRRDLEQALEGRRLEIEAERLALTRLEHDQRVREWELDAAERRQRLDERRAEAAEREATRAAAERDGAL